MSETSLVLSPTEGYNNLTFEIKFQAAKKEIKKLKKKGIELENKIHELNEQLNDESCNNKLLQNQKEEMEEKIHLLERSTLYVSPSRSQKLNKHIISSNYYIYDVILRDRIYDDGVIVYQLVVMALDHVEWEVLRRYRAFKEIADKINSKTSIQISK